MSLPSSVTPSLSGMPEPGPHRGLVWRVEQCGVGNALLAQAGHLSCLISGPKGVHPFAPELTLP